MPTSCSFCGAPFAAEAALFCAYCGRRSGASGPRLLEAISIATVGDVATPLIPYGALLPTSFADVFSTSADDQPSVVLHLLLGNATRASASRSLARVDFPIERRGPRATPRVELIIRVGADGSVVISAEELGTSNRRRWEGLAVPVAPAHSANLSG